MRSTFQRVQFLKKNEQLYFQFISIYVSISFTLFDDNDEWDVQKAFFIHIYDYPIAM